MTACSADKTLDMYDFTGGLVDRISADRMALKFTPDCKNVCLDEDAGISTRKEYIDANSTALTGSQSVLSGYVYKQDDGDQYAIVQSSNSLFAGKSASELTVISSTFTLNKRMTYESFLGNVYGGNGTDCEWKWDGVTFTEYTALNSTNMVKGKYHALWQNRMFRAGVTETPRTLYYSNINVTSAGAPDPNPADLGDGTNWEYIPANGDVITGIKPSEDGSQLYIFTNNSIWALIGNSIDNWVLKCKSPHIGCISGETIDYLNGSIVFLSKRGIEKFDGNTFTLLSENIDKQIKGLSQLNTNIGGELSQTTSADWGSGTCTNIDTMTYDGSIATSSGSTQSGTTDFSLGTSSNLIVNNSISLSFGVDSSSDIASGHSCTATNITSGTASNITDGDLNTYCEMSASGSSGEHIVTIDLGRIDIVGAITFKHSGYLINTLQVWASTDDVTYTSAGWIPPSPLLSDYVWTTSTIYFANNTTYSMPVRYFRLKFVWYDTGDPHRVRLYDAKIYPFRYSTVGTFLSNSFDLRNSTSNLILSVSTMSQGGSSISYATRSSSDNATWSSYELATNNGFISNPNRYVQVLSTFTPGTHGLYTSTISSISIYPAHNLFITQKLNAGSSWGSWGTFTAGETKPSSSTISYYAQVSTSSDFANPTTVSLTNGGVIPTPVGPYIKIIASFTRTSDSVVPMVNSISLNYFGTNTNIPTSIVYNDSYWLAVTTQSSTNNVVYRYNENGIFELYNNMNFGDFFEWQGDLYAGDSTNTGKVYKLNIGASYTDSIGDYTAEYYTPITDCGSPLTQKSYKSLWVTSSRDTVDFTVSYSIDGSDTWNTLTPTTVSTRINTYKLNFPIGLRGRYIQFKISGTNFFNVRGMSLIYEELPLQ